VRECLVGRASRCRAVRSHRMRTGNDDRKTDALGVLSHHMKLAGVVVGAAIIVAIAACGNHALERPIS
jgi:hypothetical protein